MVRAPKGRRDGVVAPRSSGRGRPWPARPPGIGWRWGTRGLVPDPPRAAAYASRTTLGGVLPDRLRPLVEATADLADRFRSAGHALYLVGGSVRDAIVADSASGRRRGRSRSRFHHRRPPRCHRELVTGWADAVWTQGRRFGTIGCRRGDQVYEITTHRAEATARTRVSPRWPSATPSRRIWPVATSPSTPWPSVFPSSRSSILSTAWWTFRPSTAHAAGSRGVFRRRPPPDAQGRPLHRRPRSRTGPRCWSRRCATTTIVSRSCRPRGSGMARQDRHGAGPLGGAVVRGAGPVWPTSSSRNTGPLPRAGPDPSPQGRVGPHLRRGGQDAAPTDCCAWLLFSMTSASRGPGLSSTVA